MKIVKYLIMALLINGCQTSSNGITDGDKDAFTKTKKAIGDAFARGDVKAVLAHHHPDVVKYFGGDNVVKGRAALEKSMAQTFRESKLEFVENRIENTLYLEETIIETCIFTIKVSPKNGGKPSYAHGRSMVTYVRFKDSPYGWVSIREMTQNAPADK